jgi:hypothetical protein
VAVSAALLLAQLGRLAYLAPGSLGSRQVNFDGFAIALAVLTMVNFGAALLIVVTAAPRNLRGMRSFRALPEVHADLTFRLSELLSRRWKTFVASAMLFALPAVVYGFSEARNVYDDGGHYYRQRHGHLTPISHDQYVAAAHPPLVAAAGVMTALQAGALLLTFLAVDRLASRGNWAIWSDLSEDVARAATERGAPAPDNAPPE